MDRSIRFDPALPVSARRDDIRAALEQHPVLVVCGETGSGKTTQLPKILLEMREKQGAHARGRIGHTQPRRIAARSVAARIAHELGTELGALVGYKVRFQEKLRADSAIKLMTDGILLAETQGDPQLARIQRAHRRRGARAQRQYRFPARLPQEPPRAAQRSQGGDRLGNARCRALLQAFRRRAGDRGVGKALPGRGALPAGGRRRGGHDARGRGAGAGRRGRGGLPRGRRRRAGVPARASARSGTRPRFSGKEKSRASSCRSIRVFPPPSRIECSSPATLAASCSPRTSPRPRSPCPASAM